MHTVKPKYYSKSHINKAGSLLASKHISEQEYVEAITVLNYWRFIHVNTLEFFKRRLDVLSKNIDKNVSTIYRLKRQFSIIKKIKRSANENSGSTKLSRMQDIAGCRIVLPNITLMNKLRDDVIQQIPSKKIKENDYIKQPKLDGYRGIHLVYRYDTTTEVNKFYNGFFVEIQLRTQLQHLWATAVETVDLFTRQALKSNQGEQKWMDFFKLVSSAFAIMEETTHVPNTPTNKNQLYSEIKSYEKELKVIERMEKWAHVVEKIPRKKKAMLSLLELDIKTQNIKIKLYTRNQVKGAMNDYAIAEKNDDIDAVLVGTDKIARLKKAYPNYFINTKEFLSIIKSIIDSA